MFLLIFIRNIEKLCLVLLSLHRRVTCTILEFYTMLKIRKFSQTTKKERIGILSQHTPDLV